jgi:hypothetical protein
VRQVNEPLLHGVVHSTVAPSSTWT